MKRYTKLIVGAVLLIAISIGYLGLTRGYAKPLSQQDTGTTQMRTIQVSGTGEIQVAPDTAVIQLGVQTQAKTAEFALSQNSSKMRSLMDTLENAGISSDNIQTQTLRLSPRYNISDSNKDRTLIGFTASNIVEVRSEDLGNLGDLLDQAVKAGANTIENINFEISDSGEVIDQARQVAVENARHKAEQLADLTNSALGPVLEVQDLSRTPVPNVRQAEAAAPAAVPVSPGSQTISVQVQITWTLTANQ